MAARILVVDDEPGLRTTLARLLEQRGYECVLAADGDEALPAAIASRIDLVLMDLLMPRRSGIEALADLRGDFRTRFLPVIFLTARGDLSERVSTLLAGADDYLLKPYIADELFARVHVALARAQALRDSNPLTGLPGNRVIREELEGRLGRGDSFDVVYADLNRFKAFNDRYGFARGDLAIGALATALAEASESVDGAARFVGHIGGDDFVVVVPAGQGVPMADAIIRIFDAAAVSLHDAEDLERGHMVIATRSGEESAPLLAVGLAIVPVRPDRGLGALELAEIAAEMKQVAKRKGPRSAWALDRRAGSAHDGASREPATSTSTAESR